MRLRSRASFLAIPVACALVLAGCGGGGSASSEPAPGWVTVRGGDPQNPLLPTDTQETEGGMVVDALWSGLEKYDPDTGQAKNEVAQSITASKKNTVFDIKIKKGWKFQDGTEVKADNFINAWNYGAYKPDNQINAPFFEGIKGYDQVNPEKGKPTAKTMSGLQKVNDYEFRVTLSAPNVSFKQKLGYTAFYPMPDSFFKAKDKEAWAKHPIGNGPFKFDSHKPEQFTKVSAFKNFSGPDKPHVKGVEFKEYRDLNAAYRDLTSGKLDFMEAVPPADLVGNRYKKDLDGRVLNGELMTDEAVAVPYYLNPKWKSPDFRHGLSMAINRDQIAKQIFNGSRKPLDGWIPSSVPGAQENVCGQFCKFDPAKAKQLIKKSGFKGVVPIISNNDGGHKEWIEAVANSINKALKGTGVTARYQPVPTFQVLRQDETAYKMTGAWRSGWNFDYPSPDNQLAALYQTGGSSNTTKYSDPKFDQALEQGLESGSDQEAYQHFAQAQKILAQDMPEIPLWTETGTAGYSSHIKSVKLSKLKRLADLTTIRLNKS